MPDYGELCLYVDPDHLGRGIGVGLVSAARARLFDLGFRKPILWSLLRYKDALEEKPGDTAIHVRLGRVFRN